MWQTVDYKGNTVKWYEAELTELIIMVTMNPLIVGGQHIKNRQKIKDREVLVNTGE